ncbi:14663_t:CDS:2, partial [Racocetra persica]
VLNVTKVSRDVIQHIFPKQFGLRNVFDHDKNGQPSVQSLFRLYQNRITEIQKFNVDMPSRLIQVLPMINQIISRHKKCGYTSLLKRYCPVMEQNRLSAPSTDDNSYIQDFNSNSNIYRGNKNNKVEADKRSELLYEFIWWIFDCFVIPLLQVREIRILDIWLRIEKYNIESLPASTFEEVPKETENQFLDNSILGYSTVRFLPKGSNGTMRRIINLSRVQTI